MATPTYSFTAIPTDSSTPSETSSQTPIATLTSTGTASFTETPVPATPTYTLTSLPPANTNTPTYTSTYTATNTASPTDSDTTTSTSSPTLTASPTVTVTNTFTATPTGTLSFTPSSTVTSTDTVTSTATATVTSTTTMTATLTSTPGPLGWVEATASAAFGERMFSGSLVYNNKMWLIGGGTDCSIQGGVKADVWSSSNGVTWSQAVTNTPFGTRWSMGAVVFNNQMWLIGGIVTGGYGNDVWSSTDGVHWTQVLTAAPFAARQSFGCVVFNNKIWVIGGDNNLGLGALSDVWSSPDGVNWTPEGNFPSPRTGASCVVFNGAIWVIAGGTAYADPSAGADAYLVNAMNDSWYSTDGQNWNQAAANAGFSGRVYAAAQVFNNQIWLLGGAGSPYFPTIPNTGVDDDVWVSSDGTNWTQAYPTLPFAERFAAGSYVFNNEFWAAGGCAFVPGGASYYADVWRNP